MKKLLPFLLALVASFSLAQTPNGHERRYELRPNPNWPLDIELGSGDYQIVATDSGGIAVVYKEDTPDDGHRIQVQISSGHERNYLKIAGPKSSFHAVIEVPRKTDLHIRMMAGDLHVGEVEGNKDIEVRAGTLELNAIHPQDYAKADFSVRIGDVTAPTFKVAKSSPLRSFRAYGPGKYLLHAHVEVGDLTLNTDTI
jgi:hypothetical protein